MSDSSWGRPHFKPGGGHAFVFFVAYGDFGGAMNLKTRHRSRGLPRGFTLGTFKRTEHPDTFNAFLNGYLGQLLQEMSAGVSAAVRVCPTCMLLRGEVRDPADLLYLRDTIGIMTSLMEDGAAVVLDATAFRWWSPAAWKKEVFKPDEPLASALTTVMVSDDEKTPGRLWLHTRGMRKFGRPDVGVYGVPPSAREVAVEICARFMEIQMLGAVVPEGQALEMASAPPGMVCRHAGKLDDPHYNNVHLRIDWPAE